MGRHGGLPLHVLATRQIMMDRALGGEEFAAGVFGGFLGFG